MKISYALIGILLYTNLYAQTHQNEIGLQVDNDSFLGNLSDRYYTNGFFIFYHHALSIKKNNLLANKIFTAEAGQKIFTPHSDYITSRQSVDRPFAGYLYASGSLNLLYKNESSVKLTMYAGVIGPAAQAEAVQRFIHKTFGFPGVDGWVYQIKNFAEINLSAEYNRLIKRIFFADISACTYLNLGNGFTGAGAGALFRVGIFNRLFNSVSTQSVAIKNSRIVPLYKKELFFHFKPLINIVVYDATIQGSFFRKYDPNSYEVTLQPKPMVISNELGVSYSYKHLSINLTAIYNSRDVKGMKYSHQWGSITLMYGFN